MASVNDTTSRPIKRFRRSATKDTVVGGPGHLKQSIKAIMDESADAIRSCSEPTKRELHAQMLRQAEKRGLFGLTRPLAGFSESSATGKSAGY